MAYAGPYASSPPSAFGHVFLVLPREAADPVPLWDVVSFSAETSGAGPLRFAARGIAGGFSGTYQRLPLHERSRDYQLLEDRDLWFVRVLLTHDERHALEEALASTAGKPYPYTFFERNCAYYLQLLLSTAVPSEIPVPSGPTSPTSVVDVVLESRLAGSSFFRPAASRRLDHLSEQATAGVVQRLRDESWTELLADTVWLARLGASDRLFVQEFMAWRATRHRQALGEAAKGGLAFLRMLNVRRPVDFQRVGQTSVPGERIPPPRFHRYSRVTVSYSDSRTQGGRVAVRFRPAAHDAFDPWTGHRLLNSLEFLSLEASASIEQGSATPRIEEVVVFSQRSLVPSTWIAAQMSWLLELLGRRGGLSGGDSFQAEARAGLGRTVEIVPDHVFGHALLTAAVVTDGSDAALAPGWDLALHVVPGDQWRLGLSWTEYHDAADWGRDHQQFEAWVRIDLARRWGVRTLGAAGSEGRSLGVAIDWYP